MKEAEFGNVEEEKAPNFPLCTKKEGSDGGGGQWIARTKFEIYMCVCVYTFNNIYHIVLFIQSQKSDKTKQ